MRRKGYRIIFNREQGSVDIEVLDSELSRRLKGTFFWSYDGKNKKFINAAGGRARTLESLSRILGFTKTEIKKIKAFFKERK